MIKRALLPLPPRKHSSKSGGFTLLELAVVLFIVALILGGLLRPLATRVEQEGRKTTRLMLEEIKASLLGYTVINGHFPCPDCPDNSIFRCAAFAATAIGDGMEDVLAENIVSTRGPGVVTNCATEIGTLPWATLGVSQADAWGQTFIYAVDGEFADTKDGETGEAACKAEAARPGVSFCLTSKGNMTIKNTGVFVEQAGSAGADKSQNIAEHIPALVFSLGANGAETQARIDDGSISDAERDNWWVGANRVFIADDYVGAEKIKYDDIMIWISTPSLMYRMISAERLP